MPGYTFTERNIYPFKKIYVINTNAVVPSESLDYLIEKKIKFFIWRLKKGNGNFK